MYYAKAGTVGLESELEAQLPQGLPDLLDLPGLGLKKVLVLWKEQNITNIESLTKACEANTLQQLKGFGPKLQAKLLEAIAFQAKHARDFYLDTAIAVADRWLEILKPLRSISGISLTGKLRRGAELIQMAEFIVLADLAELTAELQASLDLDLPNSIPIELSDPSGMKVQLWPSQVDTFHARQLVQTGGEEYSRSLGEKFGLDPEAAIQKLAQFYKPEIGSEEGLCEAAGIRWIEPELRDLYAQDPGNGRLVEEHDIKGVFHAHTTWSDGKHSLEDLAAAAMNLGYQYLGVSEHSQAAYYANGLKPDRVKAQWDLIDHLNEANAGFHIFKGIEADILSDGSLDYNEELLGGFDFVVASIHSHFHLDARQQTERIVRALQSPYTTILGHPTGRMLMARPGYDPDLTTIIDVAAENDKLIEINTTPKRLDLDWRYLKYAREKGLKISIDPDAHNIKGLSTIPLGVRMARKGGFSAREVLNTLDVEEMSEYLLSRRQR